MPPYPIDLVNLLRRFQDMWSHMRTCQEMLETAAELDYDTVKAKYDVLAEQQFRLLIQAINEPQAFAKAVRDFESMNPKTSSIH